jgi:hypothetical protein
MGAGKANRLEERVIMEKHLTDAMQAATPGSEAFVKARNKLTAYRGFVAGELPLAATKNLLAKGGASAGIKSWDGEKT